MRKRHLLLPTMSIGLLRVKVAQIMNSSMNEVFIPSFLVQARLHHFHCTTHNITRDKKAQLKQGWRATAVRV